MTKSTGNICPVLACTGGRSIKKTTVGLKFNLKIIIVEVASAASSPLGIYQPGCPPLLIFVVLFYFC